MTEIFRRKTAIIGAGHVGSHVGYALISQGLSEEIVYIDTDRKKSEAQALDLYDATAYLPKHADVYAGTWNDIADAQILVVAAGPLPDMDAGQFDRMDTLRSTVEILKAIIPNIRKSGFGGIIISISNPADVVAHYIQNALDWPKEKIISTSTALDSARLRRALTEATGYDQKSICAYVLGEHGESQMIPWSAVTVAGKPLTELIAEQPERFGRLSLEKIAERAKSAGWTILGGKGSTEFGIGAAAAEIVRAICGDENRILPVSVLLEGEYGQNGVFASVPVRLNRSGAAEIIRLKMTENERKEFAESCAVMDANYRKALSF